MIEIFSTCPRSSQIARSRYLEYVADVARWTERAGLAGTLVSSANSLVDPRIVSHVIVRNSEALRPLVAVQRTDVAIGPQLQLKAARATARVS